MLRLFALSFIFTSPSFSGQHSPVTSGYMMEMAQRLYAWMLLHPQMSYFHRIPREDYLPFTQPTLFSLRKGATMSSLILVGACACWYKHIVSAATTWRQQVNSYRSSTFKLGHHTLLSRIQLLWKYTAFSNTVYGYVWMTAVLVLTTSHTIEICSFACSMTAKQ